MNIQRLLAVNSLALVVLLFGSACDGDEGKMSLPEARAEANEGGDVDSSDAPEATADDEATPGGQSGTARAPSAARVMDGRRFSGAFEPRRTSRVAANVGGIVRKVYVQEGQAIEEGDRLVDIDSQDYQLRVEQARAQRGAAKAQAEMLQTEYARLEQLLDEEAVAPSEVDQLSGNLAAARANLAQAEVGVRMASKARRDALIRAPIDGVVTSVSVEVGDFAAPGPQPLLQVEEVGELVLRVSVPEEYSGDVHVGDALNVAVPAISETMTVSVTRINPSIVNASRSFDVLAEVENTDIEVRPGMFANVTLAGSESGGSQ